MYRSSTLLLAALLLASCGKPSDDEPTSAPSSSGTPAATVLAKAHDSCLDAGRLTDDDQTLIMVVRDGDDDSEVTDDQFVCVLKETQMPEAILQEVQQSGLGSGVQTKQWGGVTSTWSEDPETRTKIKVVLRVAGS